MLGPHSSTSASASSSPNSAPEPRFFVDSDQQSTARSLIVTSRRDDKALHVNSLAGLNILQLCFIVPILSYGVTAVFGLIFRGWFVSPVPEGSSSLPWSIPVSGGLSIAHVYSLHTHLCVLQDCRTSGASLQSLSFIGDCLLEESFGKMVVCQMTITTRAICG